MRNYWLAMSLSWMGVVGFVGCGDDEGSEGEAESEAESESEGEVPVNGVLIDPEKFLYARLGIMAKALGTNDTGACWTTGCDGATAVPLVTLGPSTIAALEAPSVGMVTPSVDGAFSFTAPLGETYHFIVSNSESTYLPTIDGAGVFCGADGALGVVLHGCGNYGMMALVAGFNAAGVASVVIMDDAGIPEFLPQPYLDQVNLLGAQTFQISVTGGEARYWIFNPTDPADPKNCGGVDEDPCWGWQPLITDLANVPAGMVWIGMFSIVNPTGETFTVNITDTVTDAVAGRPFTYGELELPVRPNHYTFAEAIPTK